MEKPKKRCCICSSEIKPDAHGWAGGYNAYPVGKGSACHECNHWLVVPARIAQLTMEDTDRENKA
tara:strand:+ start:294 stop:488 length:195 start_codon:yes stop_codon:yes gene_type:complete